MAPEVKYFFYCSTRLQPTPKPKTPQCYLRIIKIFFIFNFSSLFFSSFFPSFFFGLDCVRYSIEIIRNYKSYKVSCDKRKTIIRESTAIYKCMCVCVCYKSKYATRSSNKILGWEENRTMILVLNFCFCSDKQSETE